MQYLILIGLVILVIYGIIKLLIWITPIIAKGLLIILGAGCLAGVFVGIFYGIKNYMSSIMEHIDNKPFKIILMTITSLVVLLIAYYMIAIVYYIFKSIF
jgi:hypothetical protein